MGNLRLHGLARAEHALVRLEDAPAALLDGTGEGSVLPPQDRLLVERGLRQRHHVDRVLAHEPKVERLVVGDLDRHPGALEAVRGHGVVVFGREEVVDLPVKEVPSLPLVGVRERPAVDVVDPGQDLVGDLVVDGIVVRREEGLVVAELMAVDQQDRRIAPHELHFGVGLRLRPREHVPVEVEPVGVSPRVRLAPVGVLDGDDEHHGVVEDPIDDAIVPIGELEEDPQRSVGPALLVTVHIGDDPRDGGRRGGELIDPFDRRLGVADLDRRAPDGGEPRSRHVVGPAHDRVAKGTPLDRGAVGSGGDAVRGGGDRVDVEGRLPRRHLPSHAQREAQHAPRRRRDPTEALRGRQRITAERGEGRRGHRGGRRRAHSDEESPAGDPRPDAALGGVHGAGAARIGGHVDPLSSGLLPTTTIGAGATEC
jgi:hypothetical protein